MLENQIVNRIQNEIQKQEWSCDEFTNNSNRNLSYELLKVVESAAYDTVLPAWVKPQTHKRQAWPGKKSAFRLIGVCLL